MARILLAVGGVFGFLGVAFGAFGAHGLRDRLSPEMMTVFQTGVQYHMIHALALLIVAALGDRAPKLSGWLFTAGILIFSGSLYALALSGVRGLGAITPIGGVCFLAGWAILALTSFRQGSTSEEARSD